MYLSVQRANIKVRVGRSTFGLCCQTWFLFIWSEAFSKAGLNWVSKRHLKIKITPSSVIFLTLWTNKSLSLHLHYPKITLIFLCFDTTLEAAFTLFWTVWLCLDLQALIIDKRGHLWGHNHLTAPPTHREVIRWILGLWVQHSYCSPYFWIQSWLEEVGRCVKHNKTECDHLLILFNIYSIKTVQRQYILRLTSSALCVCDSIVI